MTRFRWWSNHRDAFLSASLGFVATTVVLLASAYG